MPLTGPTVQCVEQQEWKSPYNIIRPMHAVSAYAAASFVLYFVRTNELVLFISICWCVCLNVNSLFSSNHSIFHTSILLSLESISLRNSEYSSRWRLWYETTCLQTVSLSMDSKHPNELHRSNVKQRRAKKRMAGEGWMNAERWTHLVVVWTNWRRRWWWW
jgi:hypothetical protein